MCLFFEETVVFSQLGLFYIGLVAEIILCNYTDSIDIKQCSAIVLAMDPSINLGL